MARRVSLPSADDLFRATEEEKAHKAAGGAGKPSSCDVRPSTPYRTSPTSRKRTPASCAVPAAGSSTTRR